MTVMYQMNYAIRYKFDICVSVKIYEAKRVSKEFRKPRLLQYLRKTIQNSIKYNQANLLFEGISTW